jgi:hypothetical protein
MAGRSAKTVEAPVAITGVDPAYPTASLVASAVRYSGKTARIYNPSQHWQREAYRHYSICGEARFAAQFFANSLSRAALYSALVGPNGELTRETSGAGPENLRRIFGPQTSAQNLAAIGLHMTIAGECYLVGREHRVPDFDADVESKGEVWEVVSTLEMEVTGGKWQINYHNGRMPVELTDDDIIIRIWRPDPEKRIEADSPFRSLLPVLREIEALTLHMFAQTQSRLAGAGILFLPQGMTFPTPLDADGKPVEVSNEAEGFMRVVADTMMAVKKDQGNPASLVPIMVTAPDEAIDKARLMHFWSELDEKAMEMRSGAINRFALGMDLPPEQVLGMGSNLGTGGGTSNGVSHWGAWQIDESTVTLHIEPMLELVCAAVTISFLRPATDDTGERVVRYDTQNLRLRPDRSKESLELWDRGLIKAEVVLRENRFDPDDAMDDEERKQWLLIKIASGSATPEQVQGALGMLGVSLPTPEPAVAPVAPVAPTRESRPAPSLEDHPTRREPDRAAALLHISEALVLRGLERAGNRLRASCKGEAPKTASFETHCVVPVKDPNYLLEDAWSTAGIVLAGVAEPGEVVPVLDAYCKMLFSQQMAHSRTRLAKWLEAQS